MGRALPAPSAVLIYVPMPPPVGSALRWRVWAAERGKKAGWKEEGRRGDAWRAQGGNSGRQAGNPAGENQQSARGRSNTVPIGLVGLETSGCKVGIPANTRHWPNAAVMLGHRLRLWPSITAALGQCLVFARILPYPYRGLKLQPPADVASDFLAEPPGQALCISPPFITITSSD